MPTNSLVQVIGYRWEAGGGARACALCRGMHGREYYFEPTGSQRHVDEMPTEQLHPNCRCRRRAITAVRRPSTEWMGDETYGGDADTAYHEEEPPPPGKGLWRDPIFGAIWRKDHIWKGPVYGNYGGLDWTGGRDVSDKKKPPPKMPPPINQMDSHFEVHDREYTNGEDKKADHEANKNLLQGLRSLPQDPRGWSREQDDSPMTKQEIIDANRMRSWALGYFGGAVSNYNQEIRDNYEWGPDAEGRYHLDDVDEGY